MTDTLLTDIADGYNKLFDQNEKLRQQLAECQAQVKAAKREALLEAANEFVKNNQVDANGGWAVEELRRMAKELE
jgi:cell division septum initiation protein DivIVA